MSIQRLAFTVEASAMAETTSRTILRSRAEAAHPAAAYYSAPPLLCLFFWRSSACICRSRSKKSKIVIPNPTAITSSLSLLGGYMFNKNVGVEGGYLDLGKASMSATAAFNGTYNGQALVATGALNLDAKATGFTTGARGDIPVSDKFSLVGRPKRPTPEQIGTLASAPTTPSPSNSPQV